MPLQVGGIRLLVGLQEVHQALAEEPLAVATVCAPDVRAPLQGQG